MKRLISVVVLLGLLVGATASVAVAKKKAKPVQTTFYLHGTETVGEVDMANGFGASYTKMDSTEPSDPAPKSRVLTTWRGEPAMWNDCAGSYLLPVWTGAMSGKVVGDIKVTLHAAGAPTSVALQVWPDLMSQTCASNDLSEGGYPEPAGEVVVDLPAGTGEVEAVIEDVNFNVLGSLVLMVLPEGPAAARVLYDSPDFASRVEFSCLPASGKTCD